LIPIEETSDWQLVAACRGEPIETFFGRPDATYERAQALCSSCKVRDRCLDEALSTIVGYWGGTTEAERRRLRRERKVSANKPRTRRGEEAHARGPVRLATFKGGR